MNDKEIINNALLDLAEYYISSNIEFFIVIDNHDNWDQPLPARLKGPQFLLNIVETDLEESYIHSNGDIVITAGIDDVVYTKVLDQSDIHAIGPLGQPPMITKSFTEKPEFQPISPYMPDADGLLKSMEAFKKHNPSLFAAGVTPRIN